jgi:hypothetical protein
MDRKKRFLIAILLLAALGSASFAEGAGGLLFGMVQPGWNPGFMPAVPATQPEFEYMGGYGYGVTRDDLIIGGFGLAMLDYAIFDSASYQAADRHIAGGAGGVILGSRIIGTGFLHLDVAARLGLGGVAEATKSLDNGLSSFTRKGYAIIYAEPYVELGVGLSRWMHLAATLSYPFIGNFIPGKPFTSFLYYSPVLGVTMTFGDFRSF